MPPAVVANAVIPVEEAKHPQQRNVPELPTSRDENSKTSDASRVTEVAEGQSPDVSASGAAVTAFEYADYPEVSAVQPTEHVSERPSVSATEPPTVPVESIGERIIDNAPAQRVVPEIPVKSEPAETVVAPAAQVLPESPAIAAELPPTIEQPGEQPGEQAGEQAGESIESQQVVASAVSDVEAAPPDISENPVASVVSDESPDKPEDEGVNNEWHDMLPQLKLTGMAQQLAEHCLFKSQTDGKVTLTLDNSGETLKTTRTEEALQEALGQYFSQPQQLVFEAAEVIGETPEKRRIRINKERQIQAELAIAEDPVILTLQQKWGAVVLPGSVKPNKDVGAF